METDIEVKMLLNEISKLNDKLDSIEELLMKQKCTLNNVCEENAKTASLSNESKSQTNDNFSLSDSFPTDRWFDIEETKELAEAKKNAPAEWHSICYLQNKLSEAMNEIFKLKRHKSASETINQNDTIKEKNNGHTEIL